MKRKRDHRHQHRFRMGGRRQHAPLNGLGNVNGGRAEPPAMDTPAARAIEQLDEDRELLALDADDDAPKELMRTMYELIYLAFRTDSTRVATYQIGSDQILQVHSKGKPMAPGVDETNWMSSCSVANSLGATPPPVMAVKRQ